MSLVCSGAGRGVALWGLENRSKQVTQNVGGGGSGVQWWSVNHRHEYKFYSTPVNMLRTCFQMRRLSQSQQRDKWLGALVS